MHSAPILRSPPATEIPEPAPLTTHVTPPHNLAPFPPTSTHPLSAQANLGNGQPPNSLDGNGALKPNGATKTAGMLTDDATKNEIWCYIILLILNTKNTGSSDESGSSSESASDSESESESASSSASSSESESENE